MCKLALTLPSAHKIDIHLVSLAQGRLLMPTLIRLITVIAVLVGLVYGAMFALATFVEPKKGEMRVRIPAERLTDQR